TTKAQFSAARGDWPTYFGLLAQAMAVGGAILCSLIVIWLFGREYSDHTAKDLLALPTPRTTLVLAKLLVATFWCVVLALWVLVPVRCLAYPAGRRMCGCARRWYTWPRQG